MGRRGYVQERHAEHDHSVSLSSWAQEAACDFLASRGINVYTGDSSGMSDPEESDHWEIEIPIVDKKVGEETKYVRDVDRMNRIIADLREKPSLVSDGEGDEYGVNLAEMLEIGMKAAEKHDYNWIMVDFW